MKIYRSIELGAAQLSQCLAAETDLEFFFDPLSEDELMNSDFDLIELSEQQNQSVLSQFKVLDWDIQVTHSTDAFVRVQQELKPFHLGAAALKTFLEFKKVYVDVSKSAVLVGGYSFLMTYAIVLGKLGFKKIHLVSSDNVIFSNQVAAIKKFLFDIDIRQISSDEMANISELSSLVVTDFDLSEHADLVEVLTYFNFSAEGAIFLDLQQFMNDTLSLEAERASLLTLDSVEFHLHKYRLAQKKIK